jgi:preprotein translocase subunit YajC
MEPSMFVTPAFAQGAAAGGENIFVSIMPFILIFVVMYFLVIRPQQKRVKMHREMTTNLRRGDTVVTSGGLIGKITKTIDDTEIEVQIAENVRVRATRASIAEVRAKGEPVSAES